MARRLLKKETVDKIADLYNCGMNYELIAEKCKVSPVSVLKYINIMLDEGRLKERARTIASYDLKKEIVEKYANGSSISDLSEEYRFSKSSIYKYVNEAKNSEYISVECKAKVLDRKSKSRNTKNEPSILKDYTDTKLTVEEIAKKYNICPTTVEKMVSKAGIPKRNPIRLNDQEFIDKFRELYNSNKTYAEMAEDLNAGYKSICLYAKRFISLGYIQKRKKVFKQKVNPNVYTVAEMYNNAVPLYEISNKLSLAPSTLRNYIKLAKRMELIPVEKYRASIKIREKNIDIDNIRKLYSEGKSAKEVSYMTGASIQCVYNHTRDLRQINHRTKRMDDATKLLVFDMYQNNNTCREISTTTG